MNVYIGQFKINGANCKAHKSTLETPEGIVTISLSSTEYHHYSVEVTIPFAFHKCTVNSQNRTWSCVQTKTTFTLPNTYRDFTLQCQIEILKEEPVGPDYVTLLESGDLADVWFQIGNEIIPAHRNVLLSRCSYFKAMITAPMKESKTRIVKLKDIDSESFKYVLRYLYAGRFLTERDQAFAPLILPKAHEYDLQGLVKNCSRIMENSVNVNNVCKFYLLSVVHDCKSLTKKCADFIKENPADVKMTDGWTMLHEQSHSTLLRLFDALVD